MTLEELTQLAALLQKLADDLGGEWAIDYRLALDNPRLRVPQKWTLLKHPLSGTAQEGCDLTVHETTTELLAELIQGRPGWLA